MGIRVRVFGTLVDLLGFREIVIDYKPGLTVERIAKILAERNPKIIDLIRNNEILTAVNHRYAPLNTEVKDGDEVAFMPPVSGG